MGGRFRWCASCRNVSELTLPTYPCALPMQYSCSTREVNIDIDMAYHIHHYLVSYTYRATL
jgi:hypothetical protein